MRVVGGAARALVELDVGKLPDELWARLPFETKAKVEGGELRFEVLVPSGVEAADRNGLEEGDVAYLPEENSLCVFLDAVDDARAEKFTKAGMVVEGLDGFREVKTLATLRLEAAEEQDG
jgi:hypothetical protein